MNEEFRAKLEEIGATIVDLDEIDSYRATLADYVSDPSMLECADTSPCSTDGRDPSQERISTFEFACWMYYPEDPEMQQALEEDEDGAFDRNEPEKVYSMELDCTQGELNDHFARIEDDISELERFAGAWEPFDYAGAQNPDGTWCVGLTTSQVTETLAPQVWERLQALMEPLAKKADE